MAVSELSPVVSGQADTRSGLGHRESPSATNTDSYSSGRVVDSEGNPISDATVTLLSDGSTTITGASGEFVFASTKHGDSVIARKGELVGSSEVRVTGESIVLVSEGEQFEIFVRDADTEIAVMNAVVSMWGYSERTGIMGSVRISGVRSNDLVKVTAEGYEGMIEVIASKARSEFTFFLQRGIAVNGILVDADGRPLASAEIGIRNIARSSRSPKIRTADDGTWQVPLAEGPHHFSVEVAGFSVLDQEITIHSASGVQAISLRVPRGQDVTGTVVGLQNVPVLDAVVHTRRGPVSVGRQGEFRLVDVPQGGMDVWATSSDSASDIVSLVPPSAPLVLKLYKTRLSGSFVDQGRPVAGASIMIRSRYSEIKIETKTDLNGEFSIPGIPLASYFVSASYRIGGSLREGTGSVILGPDSPTAKIELVASE